VAESGETVAGDWTPPEAGVVGARGDANSTPNWVQKRLPSLTFPQFGQTIHAPFFGKSAATKNQDETGSERQHF